MKQNSELREPVLSEVLSHVRLPLVDPYFLFSKLETEDCLTSTQKCRDLIDEAKKFFILKVGYFGAISVIPFCTGLFIPQKAGHFPPTAL